MKAAGSNKQLGNGLLLIYHNKKPQPILTIGCGEINQHFDISGVGKLRFRRLALCLSSSLTSGRLGLPNRLMVVVQPRLGSE